MICHTNLKLAQEFGLDPIWALKHRQAFITKELWRIKEDIDDLRQECGTKSDAAIYATIIVERINEILALRKELREIDRGLLKFEDEITESMIESARKYPVELLIEFKRGKARAWCHDDKNPSLYYGSRLNIAVCPVCDKKFNAIDVLMQRDSYSFPEAVRRLAK